MNTKEIEKKYCQDVIAQRLQDARYLASFEHLENEGALSGLRMELAHESFIDWSYVNEKADYIIRTMMDIKSAGEAVRQNQKKLGRL